MKKPLRLLAGLGVLASGLALGTAPGAQALGLPIEGSPEIYLTDLRVELTSKPVEVSPPGDVGLIEAVVDETGPAQLLGGGTLTVELAPGSVYRADISDCARVDDDTAECTVPAGGGTFEIWMATPTTAGVATTNATVVAGGLAAALDLEDPAGNSDSVDTVVTAPGNGVVAGLVEENEEVTLTATDGSGRIYRLKVPEGVPGVIVEINLHEPTEADDCGETGCDQGFHTNFIQHPYYKAEDPQNPLITNKTFGQQEPCVGFGNACSQIWTAHAIGDPLYNMPYCAGAEGGQRGGGDALPDSPCINHKYRDPNKGKAELKPIWFEVLMLSNDPVELPPLRL